jgi:hypothetical protein
MYDVRMHTLVFHTLPNGWKNSLTAYLLVSVHCIHSFSQVQTTGVKATAPEATDEMETTWRAFLFQHPLVMTTLRLPTWTLTEP